ncbi:hypothetical protein LTR28_013164 [Elasticomyces elasticus]|nr:hypothetical protein LTR28_013164 [Elasticomyces elasticus]
MDTDESVVEDGKKEEKTEAESTRKRVEREKIGYEMENMSRVLPGQLKWISFGEGERYQPPTGGVILLLDTAPSEPKSLVEIKARKKPTAGPATGSSAGRSEDVRMGDATGSAAGASAAAGVLNAVDEDVEGGEEAEVPGEFEVDEEDEDEE